MTARATRYSRWNDPRRCESCGAPDSRDAAHAQGCPALAPVEREELVRIARNVEAGWAEAAERLKARANAAA